jgi:hypothetical protein
LASRHRQALAESWECLLIGACAGSGFTVSFVTWFLLTKYPCVNKNTTPRREFGTSTIFFFFFGTFANLFYFIFLKPRERNG